MRKRLAYSRSFRLGVAAVVGLIFWHFFGWQTAVMLLCLAWLLEPAPKKLHALPLGGGTDAQEGDLC